MAIEKVYLDPNAAAYTDNEIVGKVNTASVNITRAGAVEAAARPIAAGDGANIRDAVVGLSDDTRGILISRPTSGQKKIYAIQTHSDGKQEIEQSDTAES